jgi:uroporphyrinogen decarboxylase
MTHRARLEALLDGRPTDLPACSFWFHFPDQDSTPEGLAAATVEFYRHFDVDLVKLMPTGMYSVIDYGVQVRPSTDGLGTTYYASGPIHHPGDWARLPHVSPSRGMLAGQVSVVRQVREALGPDVPIIQTIFSPLTMLAKLAGPAFPAIAAEDERAAAIALDRCAADVVAFGAACLEAGADGFFFATQLATQGDVGADMYRRLGVPYDLQVLDSLRPGSQLMALHLHGVEPLFELAERYPVDIVNWEDRETHPSIAEAGRLTSRVMMGGLDRRLVAHGSPDEIGAQVKDAATQAAGGRLIVSPGCVVPTTVPDSNLQAIVDTRRSVA